MWRYGTGVLAIEALLTRTTGAPLPVWDLMPGILVVLALAVVRNPDHQRGCLALLCAMTTGAMGLAPLGLPVAMGLALACGTLAWTRPPWSTAVCVGAAAVVASVDALPLTVLAPALLFAMVPLHRLTPRGFGLIHVALVGFLLVPIHHMTWRTDPPVAVLTIDALREDQALPMLDAAITARGGTRSTVWTNSSWTLPSLASLWTGLSPQEHGAGRSASGGFRAPDAAPLWAAAREAGWSVQVDGGPNPFTGTRFGLLDGVTEPRHAWAPYEHPLPRAWSRNGRPRPWLARLLVPERAAPLSPRPGRLTWRHDMSLHLPLPGASCPELREPGARSTILGPEVPDVRLQCWREAYRSAADALDGRLAAWVDGLPEHTRILITADHGERFTPPREHGTGLDPVLNHVPLWVVGAPAPTTDVDLIDLHATIASWLGLVVDHGRPLTQPLRPRSLRLGSPMYGPDMTARVEQGCLVLDHLPDAATCLARHPTPKPAPIPQKTVTPAP